MHNFTQQNHSLLSIFSTIALLLFSTNAPASDWLDDWNFKGHIKYQLGFTDYDSNSLFNQMGYDDTTDQDVDLRLNVENRWHQWDVKVHYQIIGVYSDSLEASRGLPDSPLFSALGIPSDDTRLFDLTHVFTDSGKEALLHRLDRASVGYTRGPFVIRFGRDAVSWGNGLLYNPMDFFNPFEPTAVDKDYKTGDDMLYGQWLFNSGNDVQSVLVPRRDADSGDLGSDQGSLAFKYHGFLDAKEYDLLAAHHFGDNMLGVGAATDWRETVLRTDLTLTDTEEKVIASAVANISYSWVWGEKNVSGFLEYFYNGFGQKNGDYNPDDLVSNTELMQRLARGEVFTLGRNYLAGSITYEATPLLLLTPNVFINLDDPSAYVQFTGYYDWKQNLTVLAGFGLPIGAKGTEFGGLPTNDPNIYFSSGAMVYAKVSYYF